MMQGVVNARHEAIVRLRVRGPGGVELDVDAIVDCGFTSSLTLPMAVVTALSLARQSGGTAVLADGSIRQFDIFAAEVAGGGTWRAVLVSAVERVALGNAPVSGPQGGDRGGPRRFGGNPSAPLKQSRTSGCCDSRYDQDHDEIPDVFGEIEDTPIFVVTAY